MLSHSLINEQAPLEGRHFIQQYLVQGEGLTIEFKQRLNQPQKIAKTICSLTNTQGGILLIGIRDDKQIVGVDPTQEKYILQDVLTHYCSPPISVSLTEVFVQQDEGPFNEVSVLIVEIPEGSDKPYKAQTSQGEWKPYIRHLDQTIVAGNKITTQLENKDHLPRQPIKLNKNQLRLVDHLKRHGRITQKEYSQLVNISERRARRELLTALNLGVIRVLEHDKEDYYIL